LNQPIKGLGRHVFVPFRKALVPDIRLDDGEIVINFADWRATQTSERDQEGVEKKGENS
jgi:16S rRNA processing protein RimM